MEDPNLIYGCGHSCDFRFPKVGGMATNGMCRCVPRVDPTPQEYVELRKKIRDLVNYAAALRLENQELRKAMLNELTETAQLQGEYDSNRNSGNSKNTR